MTLESIFLDNDVEVVSQDDTCLVLEIEGRRIVIVAELDTFQNPILTVKIFPQG